MQHQEQKMHAPTTGKPFVAHPLAPEPRSAKHIWMTVGGIAVVLIALSTWAVVHFRGPAEPRLNDSTLVIAKFVNSSSFDSLSYDKQRQFYKVMDDRGKELDKEFRDKHITEPEYRTAIEAAWLGKHINHVEHYFSLPPGQERTQFVEKLVAKKIKKDTKDKNAPKDEDIDLKVDETAAEFKVEGWPTMVREQWKQFHTAYHEQKKAEEKAAAKELDKAKGSTKPVS
jgi:hypothetical protein